ncbi:MAG: hypothetical protein GC168_13450 [Candidatus Hydrogenedens sp.]|nr:hypothetical protein [Candidatus Hydrogenedens sp.]
MCAFSIRDTVKAHRGQSDQALDSRANPTTHGRPGLSKMYHQTDLMVHMLMGWKYKKVYGPLKPTIVQMLGRLNSDFPQHLPQSVKALRNRAIGILTEIHRLLTTSGENVKLSEYFTAVQTGNGVRGQILDQWYLLDNAFKDFACLPWVQIQRGGAASLVDEAVMKKHIADIGEYDLSDFYLKAKEYYPDLAAAIQYGRDNNILSRPRSRNKIVIAGGVNTKGGGGGGGGSNNLVCSGGKCVYQDGAFCTEDPGTQKCSAAS